MKLKVILPLETVKFLINKGLISSDTLEEINQEKSLYMLIIQKLTQEIKDSNLGEINTSIKITEFSDLKNKYILDEDEKLYSDLLQLLSRRNYIKNNGVDDEHSLMYLETYASDLKQIAIQGAKLYE